MIFFRTGCFSIRQPVLYFNTLSSLDASGTRMVFSEKKKGDFLLCFDLP